MRKCESCGTELHEDSDQPVTEKWLRAVGFVGPDSWRVAASASEDGPHLCFAFAPISGDVTPRAWVQYVHLLQRGWGGREVANVPIPMPATRGDVRRLLAALKMPPLAEGGGT